MPNRQSSVVSRQLSDKKRLALSDPAIAGESKGFTRTNFVEQNLRGFTLVELLVTIAIIAILSAIGLVAYSMVLKQGRDSKRMSDLRTIQSALEQYNSDQGYYPYKGWYQAGFGNGFCALDDLLAHNQGCTDRGQTAFTNQVGNPNSISGVPKTYLNSLPQDPTDPTGSTRYQYEGLPNDCNTDASKRCTSYCLYAKLENPGSATKPTACNNADYNNYNFAVIPPI